MFLLIVHTIALSAFMVGYAFGLGGTVSALLYLALLFTGATVNYAEPLLAKLRP